MKKLLISLSLVLLINVFLIKDAHAVIDGFISDCLKVDASGHTANLSIKPDGEIKAQGDSDTWVFVCITAAIGTKCTTGIAGVDDNLFGKHDDLTALQGIGCDGEGCTVGGVNGGQVPARRTNADGSAFTSAVSWSDQYLPGVIHQWSWVQADNGAGQNGTETGNLGAQQQGTFDFTKLSGDTSKCVKIGWDPRGYVFDAATLNPVQGVQVTLSKGPKGGTFSDVPSGLGLTNPDVSRPTNGQYSFYVEPGFYKLRITSTNTTIADLTTVKSGYQDLFIDSTGKTNVYQKDMEVEEVKGSVAIAHIPVTITDPTLLITTLQKLEEGSAAAGDQINIFGRVSHPKSKVILTMNLLDEEGAPVNLVKTEVTNELGEYDMFIDQEQIDSVNGKQLLLQNVNVSFELNSFYTTGVFSKKENIFVAAARKIWNFISEKISVNAATTATSYNVKPLPRYIEGVAYDANRMAIPGAIVGVYTTYSNNPMYVTVADEEGRYKVGSQHLPRFPFELRYKKPTGEIVVVDTGTFIKQNIKFFTAEGIKPFETKKTSNTEVYASQVKVKDVVKDSDIQALSAAGSSKGTGKKTGTGFTGTSNQVSPTPQTVGGSLAGSSGVMMIVVVILVLVMVGVGVFVMMKSKQTTPQY